jgi:hypothetical protein
MCKLRKTQHQNPEFGHTQGCMAINFGGKLSFILSFIFPERRHCCCYIYIFTAPNRTATVISLEPRALNAEFQHFHTELQPFISY